MTKQRDNTIETVASMLREARHVVLFTGAGISTDSGLPDYRGPDGVWTRRDKGLPPPVMNVPASAVRPNRAHEAIVALERAGKVQLLVSQNVDNLHLASGFPADKLAELHGNGQRVRCLDCDATMPLEAAGWDKDRHGNGYRTDPVRGDQPDCPSCGGRLISSIVNFGDPMPERELSLAFAHAERCDLFVVIGSSLVVSPANDLPQVAVASGAALVILNRGETPLDDIATVTLADGIGEVLPAIAART